MKPGRASRTAELVCTGRALAHGRTAVSKFDDPTAFELLPHAAQRYVARIRSGEGPRGLRERVETAFRERQSLVMVVRTVVIDDAIRAAAAPQLVILGAGLDGRAWRMPELRDAVVFEVDHPDTQGDKRARVSGLKQAARDVRFVPVDFERDSLDRALRAAGHDPALATTWVWEGVVMYLAPADVEATLAVIQGRSAPGSRLILVYHRPALMLRAINLFVARLGEPFRSAYTPEAMRSLLAKYGFELAADAPINELGAGLSREVGQATKYIDHLRVATADRKMP